MNKVVKIEISAKTIIFTVLLLVLLNFLWLARDLLFSLFIAFIIMSAVKPAVAFLERKRIPRPVSALFLFIIALVFFGYLMFWIFPPIIIETTLLFKNLPLIIEQLNPMVGDYVNLKSLSQYIPNITNQAFSIIGGVFSNTVFVMSTLFFGFYLVVEENLIKNLLARFFEEKTVRVITQVSDKIEQRMSSWFWGELILMTIVGVMTFIGLSLVGIKYALPLAIIAGLLEIVPNLGPTISAIPAVLIALTQSYFLGFSTVALYFVVQQLENNVVVPVVMRRVVGLNPIVTLMALIVGGKVAGVLGVLLGIPFTLFIETLIMEISKYEAPEQTPSVNPR